MRRRIYIDPEGLRDITDSPYLYDTDHYPNGPLAICDIGALYDEVLWEQYQAANAELRRLHREVVLALRSEPYDAVEIELAKQVTAIIENYRTKEANSDATQELERLEILAIENARAH